MECVCIPHPRAERRACGPPAATRASPANPLPLLHNRTTTPPPLVQNKTVGIIGAGRIGTAYARMMVEGHKCDLVYYDPYPNTFLEEYVRCVALF